MRTIGFTSPAIWQVVQQLGYVKINNKAKQLLLKINRAFRTAYNSGISYQINESRLVFRCHTEKLTDFHWSSIEN